jgi:hypothetical protein
MALCLLAGCQSGGGVTEWLDASTGLTLVTGKEPAAFARTDARVSRSARDYVFLGPVEVNERGAREYYLWVGIGSTIDRRYLNGELPAPTVLWLDLAGSPTEFGLEQWDQRLSRLAGRQVYDPAVTIERVLVARMTLDQLVLLARESIASIRVAADDGAMTEYFPWNSRAEWSDFVQNAGSSSGR